MEANAEARMYWRPIVFGMFDYSKAREETSLEPFIKMNEAIDFFFPKNE